MMRSSSSQGIMQILHYLSPAIFSEKRQLCRFCSSLQLRYLSSAQWQVFLRKQQGRTTSRNRSSMQNYRYWQVPTSTTTISRFFTAGLPLRSQNTSSSTPRMCAIWQNRNCSRCIIFVDTESLIMKLFIQELNAFILRWQSLSLGSVKSWKSIYRKLAAMMEGESWRGGQKWRWPVVLAHLQQSCVLLRMRRRWLQQQNWKIWMISRQMRQSCSLERGVLNRKQGVATISMLVQMSQRVIDSLKLWQASKNILSVTGSSNSSCSRGLPSSPSQTALSDNYAIWLNT